MQESAAWVNSPAVGDDFAINIREECLVESHIVDVTEDSVVLAADEHMMRILESYGMLETADPYRREISPPSAEEFEEGMAEGKKQQEYKVYIQDTDGSERLGSTITAKSLGHARELAKQQGLKNITSIELKKQGMAEGLDDLRRLQELAGMPPAAMPAVQEGAAKNWVNDLYYEFQERHNIPRDIDDDMFLAMVDKFLQREGIDSDKIEAISELFLDMRDHEEDNDHDYANQLDAEQYDDEPMMDEAKYQGREVPLGKPMQGDVKKSKVYVRGPKGNVVKVNFGDKTMKIKKSNPKRRKNFRARHNCANPGPRHKARYWSCRAW